MKRYVLTIAQMRELQEIGIDTSDAHMFYLVEKDPTRVMLRESPCLSLARPTDDLADALECIPTYTLEDMLSKIHLPYKVFKDSYTKTFCIRCRGFEYPARHFETLLECGFDFFKHCMKRIIEIEKRYGKQEDEGIG